ncbi:SurA N-terminal domain-containing protein [Desulfonatronum thiosulfatophilum]|nr:SurA N-terminal domain-containing protein [Desulfonatronum thiosulfatophilum]
MRITPFSIPFLLALAVVLAGSGCSSPMVEDGVVARINGQPVYLAQLEAVHDLKYLARTTQHSSSLGRLRQEYGAVLSEIVVQYLVAQFLEERGLAVSENELGASEAQVRADYPEGAFEQTLVEEYVHLDRWREQLKATLSQEKLLQKVLRPSISIDYQEVDSYYRNNIGDFYLHPRVEFLFIHGRDRDLVERVLEMSASEPDPVILGKRFDRVGVYTYNLREDNLSTDWQALLVELEPKQATSILMREPEGHYALVLLERTQGRIIDPAQAYPLVERILVERKMEQAFDAWLADALASANIVINQQLLEETAG